MSDKKFDTLKQLLSGGATSGMCLFNIPGTSDDLIVIGGTREETFNLPFSVKLIKKMLITYTENGSIILKKHLDDCEVSYFNDSLLYFTLSEEETSNFTEGDVELQMKVLLEDGSILVSAVLHAKAVETIDDRYFVRSDEEIYSLQANVNNQEINVVQFFEIAADSDELYNCRFTFDSSWEKFDKVAIFKDEYNHLIKDVKIKNNVCQIPTEVIAQPGLIYVGVLGTRMNVKKPTEWSNSIRVSNSCTYTQFASASESGGGGSGGDIPYADETTAGKMKLYQEFGDNDDGAISQTVVTKGFNDIKLKAIQYEDEGIELIVDSDFE